MRYLPLLLLLVSCSPTDPVEASFTAYTVPLLNDPESYEFVKIEKVNKYALTWEEHVAARRKGVSKDSLYGMPPTDKGHSDVWATYRAKNKLGGVVTSTMYCQYENGQILQCKEWRDAVPED